MSGQSAFDKRYVDPKDQSQVEGLLEHFNLPPKLISFLRENKRAVQIALAIVVIAVVSGSLYKSYRESQIEKAASALALALKETGSEQIGALQRVAEEYSSTSSGLWAKVEIAHLELKEEKYQAASQKYAEIHQEVSNKNPLFGLTAVGIAQAEEAQKNFSNAIEAFEKLQQIEGYQLIGYTGVARIYETQGNFEKALGIYGQYLSIIGDDPGQAASRQIAEQRISRLKARK